MLSVIHIAHCVFDANHPDRNRLALHPGRWVLNLALAQKASGSIHPVIVTPLNKASRMHVGEIEGIKIHYVALPPFRIGVTTGFWYEKFRIARYVKSLNPDIVHAHGTEGVNAMAAQQTKRPTVLTAQGMMFMIVPVLNPSRRSMHRKIQKFEHRTLLKAEHVIAKSDNVAHALSHAYPHLTLHRIPNTFDPRILNIRESRQPRSLAFVGAIDARKGVHYIVEAMSSVIRCFPDIRLCIIGDRGTTATGYEFEQITRLREILGNRLRTFGRVPGLEVARIVSQSTALLAPSLEEMFGNQLIEALLVGTHGIVSEGTGLAENARRFGNATVVPQKDPQALAEAIIQTLRRHDFPEREQARKRIIEYMGPATVANAHYDLYQTIIHKAL